MVQHVQNGLVVVSNDDDDSWLLVILTHLLLNANLFAYCCALGARSFCPHFLKLGILCLQLCAPVTVPTLSASTSKLITSSKHFHPPRYLPPCASDSAFADIVCVYKFHLLTFLLTKRVDCPGSDEPGLHVRRTVLVVRWPWLYGDRVLTEWLCAQVPRTRLLVTSAHRHASAPPTVPRYTVWCWWERSENCHRICRRSHLEVLIFTYI